MLKSPWLILFGSLFFVATLPACATSSAEPSLVQPAHSSAKTNNQSEAPKAPTQALDGETFFKLFLAEMAVNRKDLPAATALYSEIANTNNDVSAIRQAAWLAQTAGQFQLMQTHTLKWLSLRPTDEDALKAHSLASAAIGELFQSTQALDHVLAENINANLNTVLPALGLLSEPQRQTLASQWATLNITYPKSGSLFYLRARLSMVLGDPDTALELSAQAITLDNSVEVGLFHYQLLRNGEQNEQAEQHLKALRATYPDDQRVAFEYANFLYITASNNSDELNRVYEQFSNDPSIARIYARAAFDNNDTENAEVVFNRLLQSRFNPEAHYFLGQIDVQSGLFDQAAQHFSRIKTQPYWVPALADWAEMARPADEENLMNAIKEAQTELPNQYVTLTRLLASYFSATQQPQKAQATLNNALETSPENLPLLYDAAMQAANVGELEIMEKHLMKMLSLDPNNIDALNALGYTWADNNIHLEKAEQFIDQALAADPNSPAFQDSKGWVLYRLGDLSGALVWLEKAYENLKNDEVAAHISEVCWALGNQPKAERYRLEVEKLNPTSRYLEHLNRLFGQ